MKKEDKKPFIQCDILGAIGGILMAAGDWLLGCVPLQKTDTGMFNRACYMVKALNTDIDARYTRTKAIQYFCGLFTVVVALSIHLWAATLAWFSTYLGPRIGAEAAITAVTAYQDDMLPAILPMYVPMLLFFWDPFRDAACQ